LKPWRTSSLPQQSAPSTGDSSTDRSLSSHGAPNRVISRAERPPAERRPTASRRGHYMAPLHRGCAPHPVHLRGFPGPPCRGPAPMAGSLGRLPGLAVQAWHCRFRRAARAPPLPSGRGSGGPCRRCGGRFVNGHAGNHRRDWPPGERTEREGPQRFRPRRYPGAQFNTCPFGARARRSLLVQPSETLGHGKPPQHRHRQ
jgi:hypothetical protein